MSLSFGAALRERQGLSVRALARALGTSRSFIRELERGETRPSPTRVTQLSDILHTDPEHLSILTGRVPHDIVEAFQSHPALLDLIRSHNR